MLPEEFRILFLKLGHYHQISLVPTVVPGTVNVVAVPRVRGRGNTYALSFFSSIPQDCAAHRGGAKSTSAVPMPARLSSERRLD